MGPVIDLLDTKLHQTLIAKGPVVVNKLAETALNENILLFQ